MKLFDFLTPAQVTEKARQLFREERTHKTLNGWFLARELAEAVPAGSLTPEEHAAAQLKAIIEGLPLDLSEHAIFAGTQRDAFAASYALINPAFQVETFRGYCDPLEVYHYATPAGDVTAERIHALREKTAQGDYAKSLSAVYAKYGEYTGEVAFFVEQVTGHLIPDFRGVLKHGTTALIANIDDRLAAPGLSEKLRRNLMGMRSALECVVILAHRYAELVHSQVLMANQERAAQLALLESTLRTVPEQGAHSLYEAIQSYLLLWQVMCLEQAPNPFAFSVGNADRIFAPYLAAEGLSRDAASALFKHFLVFFNVGERSWAISQNILVSGRDVDGSDLTNDATYALLDAYHDMNLPQPILSVKLHQNTPEALYRSLGRFFFTPGCLTPSIFNDDSLFETLREHGVAVNDLPDYSVAGCQEPLIMGKDSANTTNSWLNLGKLLELTLSGGVSTLSGEKIGPQVQRTPLETLKNLRGLFYKNVEHFASLMAEAANSVTASLSLLPVPFLSCFMGGIESGVDLRDVSEQGTPYNGSGCLIHGLSVVADSFVAVDRLLAERPQDAPALLDALKNNYNGYEELRKYLHACPKFGNNDPLADNEAAAVAQTVSALVENLKNNWGNPFRPDWSSPSTHLLYGYWVGATPDGRAARDMLGYGVDPLYGDAASGLGFRTLSVLRLPFEKMSGGYASHFGIDPAYFTADTKEEKGIQFYQRVVKPLFFNESTPGRAPFYLYVNVTTPETLRLLLSNTKRYAPSGVYIMRIHGTFVNFLDLSPAIQQDIITRLDLKSTVIA